MTSMEEIELSTFDDAVNGRPKVITIPLPNNAPSMHMTEELGMLIERISLYCC